MTPVAILVQGHRFGVGNHEIVVAFARRLNDPSFLPGDWMLGTAVPHPLSTGLLAVLMQWVSAPVALLLFQFATRFLLMSGVARFVLALAPRAGPVAVLVAMLFVIREPRLDIGGHYLHGGSWEAAHLGMALAVWSLALGIEWLDRGTGEDRRRESALAGAAAGLMILGHLFVAAPVAGAMGLACLLRRRPARELVVFCGMAGIVGAAALIPAAVGFLLPGPGALGPRETIALLQWRHPHHHMPWTWPPAHLAQGALAFAAAAVLAARVRAHTITVFAAVVAASCVAFWITGRALVVPVIAFFQPFRQMSLFYVVLAACGGAMLERGLDGTRWRGMATSAAWAAAAWFFRTTPVPAALLGLVLNPRQDCDADAEPAPSRPWLQHAAWATGAAALLAIIVLQNSPAARDFANARRPLHWLVSYDPMPKARRELANWIRANTPAAALFAIPPDLDRFRLIEERPIILDIKNFPHRGEDLAEWSRRYQFQMSEKSTFAHDWRPMRKTRFAPGRGWVMPPMPDYAVVKRAEFDPASNPGRLVFLSDDYAVISFRADETLPAI